MKKVWDFLKKWWLGIGILVAGVLLLLGLTFFGGGRPPDPILDKQCVAACAAQFPEGSPEYKSCLTSCDLP